VYTDPVVAELDRLTRLAEAAGGPVDFASFRPTGWVWLQANSHLLDLKQIWRKAENAYIESRSATGWQPGSMTVTGQLALDLPIAPDNLIALSDQTRLYQRAAQATYDQLMAHRTVRENAMKRSVDAHNKAMAQIDEAIRNWARRHRQLRDVWRDLYGYTGP
jgi:hypothetical protein